MTLKGQGSGPLPPLLQQYVELRDAYPEYLLLFQVGDFYETFGEDAERLAVRITESGRRNVGLFRATLDIPPSTRERIWQRVRERLEREIPADITTGGRA